MIPEEATNPEVRHEFVLLFDVVNSNPNGDPDAGNLPRIDPESNQGIVTDVSLKRKIRDFVTMAQGNQPPYQIFIQSDHALNTLKERAAEDAGQDLKKLKKDKKKVNRDVRAKLCEDYFDIRCFGAVLSTGDVNAGQVRGPAQLTFARSIDKIMPMDISITRQARTTEERMETGQTEMGRKAVVPYGLYLAKGFYNPFLGEETGFSQADLEVLWNAIRAMFDFTASASKPEMRLQGLYVFTHDSKLGNAPAHHLFDLVQINRREGVEVPRDFTDYNVTVHEPESAGIDGVKLHRIVEPLQINGGGASADGVAMSAR